MMVRKYDAQHLVREDLRIGGAGAAACPLLCCGSLRGPRTAGPYRSPWRRPSNRSRSTQLPDMFEHMHVPSSDHVTFELGRSAGRRCRKRSHPFVLLGSSLFLALLPLPCWLFIPWNSVEFLNRSQSAELNLSFTNKGETRKDCQTYCFLLGHTLSASQPKHLDV